MHVRRIEGKIEENEENRGTNDKRIMRIISSIFPFLAWSSLLFYLSHTLAHVDRSWSILEARWIWRKKAKESMKVQGDSEISSHNWIALKVLSCVYDLIASFGMHVLCMWLFGYDFSLAWRIFWIDSGFS